MWIRFFFLLSCRFLQPDQHVVRHHHRFLHRGQLSCHVCRTKVSFSVVILSFLSTHVTALISVCQGCGWGQWVCSCCNGGCQQDVTTWINLCALANFTLAVFMKILKQLFSIFLLGMNTTGLMELTSKSPSNVLLPSILTTWWHGCRINWMMKHFSLPRLVSLRRFFFFRP